jgi:hypothetical protein
VRWSSSAGSPRKGSGREQRECAPAEWEEDDGREAVEQIEHARRGEPGEKPQRMLVRPAVERECGRDPDDKHAAALAMLAFGRDQPHRRISSATGSSSSEITEASAASSNNRRNATAAKAPKGIFAKVSGSVTNTRLDPLAGSRPFANTSGNTAKPDKRAKACASSSKRLPASDRAGASCGGAGRAGHSSTASQSRSARTG